MLLLRLSPPPVATHPAFSRAPGPPARHACVPHSIPAECRPPCACQPSLPPAVPFPLHPPGPSTLRSHCAGARYTQAPRACPPAQSNLIPTMRFGWVDCAARPPVGPTPHAGCCTSAFTRKQPTWQAPQPDMHSLLAHCIRRLQRPFGPNLCAQPRP